MFVEYSKWWQTIKISWNNQMAYKLNLLLMVILPATANYFVKANIWASIYALNGVDQINNYGLQEMLNYQAWVLIVALLSLSYINSKVAEDIRMGRISAFLLYPFQFWKYHVAGFLGFQFTQVFIAAVSVVFLVSINLVEWPGTLTVLKATIIALHVGVLWFLLQFILALLSFWMEETWVLRVMLYLVAQFLAGGLIPLDLYPLWLQEVLRYTPFPYLIYVPIKLFMGEYPYGFTFPFMVISFWIFTFAICAKVIWNRGIRLYTAAGM